MPDAFAADAAHIAVVGQARVGKRALALALGAVPQIPPAHKDTSSSFTWRERPLELIRDRWRVSTTDTAVVVVFDLTRKESLEAALAQVRCR